MSFKAILSPKWDLRSIRILNSILGDNIALKDTNYFLISRGYVNVVKVESSVASPVGHNCKEEDPILEDTEGTQNVELDWSVMLQAGMTLGKSILGEEEIERLKKGEQKKEITSTKENSMVNVIKQYC